ncbi:class I SAM-dependent methyltransferase [Patescibacteria group bacterium]|nr:class I SAM-dependent methyltransferase [Patescibacteria group bacterium]
MPVESHIYDDNFFHNTIKFEADSAKAFVDIILEYFSPESIIDIGCGAGIYLFEFEKRGVKDVFGIDGSEHAKNSFLLSQDKLEIFDLAKEYQTEKKFDLCLCVEVAEHLREEDADTLVNTIIESSDLVIFTAAVPGQGPRSIGHINEQPHEYWIKKFSQNNYSFLDDLTKEMRLKMQEQKVVWWIVSNLMIFKKKEM